jgi:TRAP-type C4-dicarboxylate transport system substrate-binding protein
MRARILSFAVLLAFAFGLSDVDAQPITLKFSHFLGPTSFFQLDVVEPWAKELEAKTNGKVKVEIHDGTSPLGKVTEQASKAQACAVDIALGLRGAEGDRFREAPSSSCPFWFQAPR